MNRAETGEQTSEGFGDRTQLYQQRAVKALPILVRQAQAETKMFYADLANELGMPNARNLNFVLGAVGGELEQLSKEWAEKIPPLTCIIVNQQNGLPGNGIGWFVEDGAAFKKKSFTERRRIVEGALAEIYNYRRWDAVLSHFSIEPTSASSAGEFEAVSREAVKRYGGGEGDEHRDLKLFIADHPKVLGLPKHLKGEIEHPFPSADRLDVLFRHKEKWAGFEVKGPASDEVDLERGLFQCVKYQALLEAEQKVLNKPIDCSTSLVIGTPLSTRLEKIRATLGIPVCVVSDFPKH